MPDNLLPFDGEAFLVLDAMAMNDAYQLAGLTRAVVGGAAGMTGSAQQPHTTLGIEPRLPQAGVISPGLVLAAFSA